jgi:hypothetical protein
MTMQEGVSGVFERGSAGSDEESLERERQNAISREPTVKLDFVTKK